MGVRFFFVVSGLLITWLMLAEERRTQKVDLRRFYIRRTLRILPVYVAFLAVAAILQWSTPCDHTLRGWIGNLTFTRNFVLHDNHISDHLWSLAVEEQFYLLWPFAFVCMTPALRARVMPYWVGVTVFAAFISRFIEAFPLSESSLYADVFQERSFFNNADALAIGCLAAVWLSTNEARLRAILTSCRVAVFLLGIGMLMEPYAVHWLTEREWLPPALKGLGWVMWSGLGRTIQSVGFVILVLQSIMLPTWGLYRCLNWRAVTSIGVLSYSIYMWQNIFFTDPATFGLPPVWWMTWPLWLVPAFVAGILSYHLLEKPFLKLRHHFRAPLPA